MIDLTLNSIIIPDITNYTPPFGTKIIRNSINKGGLSTREVTNNIIAYFGKQRMIIVSSNEETSTIEYDAKLYINAGSQITLTLGNGTYKGCIIDIMNPTTFDHTMVCTTVNGASTIINKGENVQLIWNGTAWQNLNAPAIGKCIAQYPQEKEPKIIYPCTKWEVIDYNGAFFRTYKENVSDEFITEENTLILQSHKTAVNGLKFNGTAVTSENEDGRPVFAGKCLGHAHPLTLYMRSTTSNGYGFCGASSNWDAAIHNVGTTDTTSAVLSGTTSGSHQHPCLAEGTISSTDTETRPMNYAFKIWKRIA